MRLKLYSSRRGDAAPHLVAIQSDDLDMLATVLVCRLANDVLLTRVRTAVTVGGKSLIVLCELARPIHRRGLQPAGELSEADSANVMMFFGLLLARP